MDTSQLLILSSAREMRHQIALAEFVYDEPNDGEEQPRWSFVPRFVRRDAWLRAWSSRRGRNQGVTPGRTAGSVSA